MGTRAIIRFEGKPLVATHWDGYPESLGKDLEKAHPKNPSAILRIANRHTIDAADLSASSVKRLQEKRFEYISRMTKGKYSVEQLKKLDKEGGQINFTIMTPKEYPIGNLDNYDDFAEYEYNVEKDGSVKVRKLPGTYKQNKYKNIPFKSLSREKRKLNEMV